MTVLRCRHSGGNKCPGDNAISTLVSAKSKCSHMYFLALLIITCRRSKPEILNDCVAIRDWYDNEFTSDLWFYPQRRYSHAPHIWSRTSKFFNTTDHEERKSIKTCHFRWTWVTFESRVSVAGTTYDAHGHRSIDSVPTHFWRLITLPGHQLLQPAHIVNMLEPVNMFTIASFFHGRPEHK